jgi:hypothetical protein
MSTKKRSSSVSEPKSSGKASRPAETSKLSALDAAHKVLAAAKEPMNCKELIEAMAKRGLWTSPGGKTPHATLSAAIGKEIAAKGKESRFRRTGPGRFAAAK